MCPRSVATNLPVRPSHTRTELSHAALAAQRPSGLNATCATCRWCPVRRARGLSFPPRSAAAAAASPEAVREGKSDHRKSVWSSEPEMSSSPAVETRALYRARASDCAVDGGRSSDSNSDSVGLVERGAQASQSRCEGGPSREKPRRPGRSHTRQQNAPSLSEVVFLPRWSKGPVRSTKSALRVNVVTQCAWSLSMCRHFPWVVPDEHAGHTEMSLGCPYVPRSHPTL